MPSTTVINEIWTYLISPVKAPPLRTQQFCAATWKSDRNKLFTKGRNTNGGLTTTSARNKTSEPYWKQEYYGHQRSSNKNIPTTSSEGTSASFNVVTIFFTSSIVPFCNTIKVTKFSTLYSSKTYAQSSTEVANEF